MFFARPLMHSTIKKLSHSLFEPVHFSKHWTLLITFLSLNVVDRSSTYYRSKAARKFIKESLHLSRKTERRLYLTLLLYISFPCEHSKRKHSLSARFFFLPSVRRDVSTVHCGRVMSLNLNLPHPPLARAAAVVALVIWRRREPPLAQTYSPRPNPTACSQLVCPSWPRRSISLSHPACSRKAAKGRQSTIDVRAQSDDPVSLLEGKRKRNRERDSNRERERDRRRGGVGRGERKG